MSNPSTLFNFFELAEHWLYASAVSVYTSLVAGIIISIALCVILASLAYVFSLSSKKDSEKLSEYECGFEPFDSATRLPFDVHFYLVGILFLIFDVEVALLFPWALDARSENWFAFYLVLGFIALLGVGFLYEWRRGALIWPSRQREGHYSGHALPVMFVSKSDSITNDMLFDLQIPPVVFQFPAFSVETASILHPSSVFFGEVVLTSGILSLLTLLLVRFDSGASWTAMVAQQFRAAQKFALGLTLLFVVQAFLFSADSIDTGEDYLANGVFILSMKALVSLATAYVIGKSRLYFSTRSVSFEVPLFFLLVLLFLLCIVGSVNLIGFFLALVGASLGMYVLIISDSRYPTACEAGVKYFVLSALSAGLILIGAFYFLVIFGSVSFSDMQAILEFPNDAQRRTDLVVALAFFVGGLLFKLSAFPGHSWAADVYDGAPAPIMAFFMLPVKIAILAFGVHFFGIACASAHAVWGPILLLSAIFSLFIGCVSAIYEPKLKRFLAFTSINQIGFLLAGAAVGTVAGFSATILYLIVYVLATMIFLAVFLRSRYFGFRSPRYLADLRGLSGWGVRFLVAVSVLSMAGIPPMAGFFGKFFLIAAALNNALYILVIVALITSFISAYYYLRLIVVSTFEAGETGRPQLSRLTVKEMRFWTAAAVLICLSPSFSGLLLTACQDLVHEFLYGAALFASGVPVTPETEKPPSSTNQEAVQTPQKKELPKKSLQSLEEIEKKKRFRNAELEANRMPEHVRKRIERDRYPLLLPLKVVAVATLIIGTAAFIRSLFH